MVCTLYSDGGSVEKSPKSEVRLSAGYVGSGAHVNILAREHLSALTYFFHNQPCLHLISLYSEVCTLLEEKL